MSNCPNCNADITDKAKFCENCGEFIELFDKEIKYDDKKSLNDFDNLKKIIIETLNIQYDDRINLKFNYENNDYLIYSIDENEVNKQIFVSKLILNSEGKSFIDNILPEEKNKLSNVVYNIIILTPSNFKKGALANNLLKDIKEKLMVNLSLEIPELGSQEYFANCSIAITNKEFVEDAIKFYNDNLNMEKVQEQIPVTPTWTIPTEEPVAINEPSINQEPMQNNINISPIPNAMPQTNPQPVIPNATSNNIESVPIEPVNIVNPTIETPNQVVIGTIIIALICIALRFTTSVGY